MTGSLKFTSPTALALLLLWGLPLSACSFWSGDKPPLPDSTFTQLLVEMHVTKARTQLDTVESSALSDSVLTHYDVSRADLNETLRYYSRRPQAFSSLYDAVIDTLSSTQRRVRTRSRPNPDSLTPPDM